MKAKYKGQAEWSEWVIKDDYLWTQYIQSAPGSKVSPRFHPDNREVVGNPRRGNPFPDRRPRALCRASPLDGPGTHPDYLFHGDRGRGASHSLRSKYSECFHVVPRAACAHEGIEFIPVRLGRHPFRYSDHNNHTSTSTIWRQPTQITTATVL